MVTRRSFAGPPARRLAGSLAVLRAAVLLAGLASTALASAQDYDAAGRHFAAGQERQAMRRFHTAALHFQAAYDITKDPVLLFNVAEAYQKAGEPQKASRAYRAYLKERPGAQDHADIERRVALLESKNERGVDESIAGDRAEAEAVIASGGAPPLNSAASTAAASPGAASTAVAAPSPSVEPAAATPASSTEPPAPRPADASAPAPQVGLLDDRPAGRLRVAAWCSVAATIALLTTGAILGLAAQSRGDEVGRRLGFVDSSGQPREFDAGARADFQSLRDEGRLYNGLAIGFYSAAGAMAITTAALFIVDWKKGRAQASPQALRIAPVLTPGAAGLVLGGSF